MLQIIQNIRQLYKIYEQYTSIIQNIRKNTSIIQNMRQITQPTRNCVVQEDGWCLCRQRDGKGPPYALNIYTQLHPAMYATVHPENVRQNILSNLHQTVWKIGMQTSMAQGRSSKIISMITWIRTSRLSILSLLCRRMGGACADRGTARAARAPSSAGPPGISSLGESHLETLIIYQLSLRKFTTQNEFDE